MLGYVAMGTNDIERARFPFPDRAGLTPGGEGKRNGGLAGRDAGGAASRPAKSL